MCPTAHVQLYFLNKKLTWLLQDCFTRMCYRGLGPISLAESLLVAETSPRRLQETSWVSWESRKIKTCSIFGDFCQSPASFKDVSATSRRLILSTTEETSLTSHWLCLCDRERKPLFWSPESLELRRMISRGDVSASEIGPLMYYRNIKSLVLGCSWGSQLHIHHCAINAPVNPIEHGGHNPTINLFATPIVCVRFPPNVVTFPNILSSYGKCYDIIISIIMSSPTIKHFFMLVILVCSLKLSYKALKFCFFTKINTPNTSIIWNNVEIIIYCVVLCFKTLFAKIINTIRKQIAQSRNCNWKVLPK